MYLRVGTHRGTPHQNEQGGPQVTHRGHNQAWQGYALFPQTLVPRAPERKEGASSSLFLSVRRARI